MDEPARKRRKTASPSEGDRSTSPLKQPPRRPSLAARSARGSERARSPLKEPPRRFSVSPSKTAFDRASSPLRKPPRRPSFASPTKATLARNYPSLLSSRPASAASNIAPEARTNPRTPGDEARALVGDFPHLDGAEEEHHRNVLDSNGSPQDAEAFVAAAERVEAKSGQRQGTPLGEEVPVEHAELPSTVSQLLSDHDDIPRRGILYSAPGKPQPRAGNTKRQARSRLEAARDAVEEAPAGQFGGNAPAQDAANQEQATPFDPELQRRKNELARLKEQCTDLEGQVSRCTNIIVDLQAHPSKHEFSAAKKADMTDLMAQFIEYKEETSTPAISDLLCSFLPFSTSVVAAPTKESLKTTIASHKPIELDDPMPYLQLFTAFEITTKLELPQAPHSKDSKGAHQKHTIELIGPQKLLTATVSVLLDTLSNSIDDLKVLRLPAWAERELGTFMRSKAKSQDLGNACWAIGSYWDLASKRAEHWHKCEIAFGHLKAGQTKDDAENVSAVSSAKSVTRKDLHRHLGRDAFILQDRHVIFRVSWKITFDWTGDAKSSISAEAAVPEIWTEADENGSLKKIPETFDALLRSKGVFAATKTMIALLFNE